MKSGVGTAPNVFHHGNNQKTKEAYVKKGLWHVRAVFIIHQIGMFRLRQSLYYQWRTFRYETRRRNLPNKTLNAFTSSIP